MAYAKVITNKFGKECSSCGNYVSQGDGHAVKDDSGSPWRTLCIPCKNGNEPTPAQSQIVKPTFPLTSEQEVAVAKFTEGNSLAIQAGAGTGKTSTLVAIANSTSRHGQYVAFNKAIVTDAAAKLPRSCSAATAHSLAFRQVGKHYRHRLDSARQSSKEIAQRLHIDPFNFVLNEENRNIPAHVLAGYVAKAITTFCNSADEEPGTKHFSTIDGIDLPDEEGKKTHTNNNRVRRVLQPALEAYWEDIVDTEGSLRFTHDCYLKIWELGIHGDPIIPGDYILFDEAQDASPVLLSAVEKQNCQVVFVGDAQQAIYEWRGAVDAMNTVPSDATCFLTNSFRFGEEIAEVANAILETIDDAELRLVGRGKPGSIEAVEAPDAVLTRTNAGAVSVVLSTLEDGRKPHLVGGGGDVERFAKGAKELANTGSTNHPELCIFDSWAQVQEYVASDPQGSDLTVLVKLIDSYGVDTVLRAVANTVSEWDADVVISTAHKSKGREWDRVRIHSDFPQAADSDGEKRLLYVAVTRARQTLDIEYCSPVSAIVYGEAHDAPETRTQRRGLPSDYYSDYDQEDG